jgi:hypothetical protein
LFLLPSFLLIIESYIEGEFLLFMILHYIMHFSIYDHEFCLCSPCSTYALMYFVECFGKYDTFGQFVRKKRGEDGEMMVTHPIDFVPEIAKGGVCDVCQKLHI